MPDNADSYYVAYAVTTGIYIAYAAMLVLRWKRVKSRPAESDFE